MTRDYESLKAWQDRLHATIERGIEAMEAETGCSDERAEKLLTRWSEIEAEYDEFHKALLESAQEQLFHNTAKE